MSGVPGKSSKSKGRAAVYDLGWKSVEVQWRAMESYQDGGRIGAGQFNVFRCTEDMGRRNKWLFGGVSVRLGGHRCGRWDRK